MFKGDCLERSLSILFIIFIIFIFATPNNVDAQEIVSTPEGGLWNENSTWLGGIIPGEGDDVIINGEVIMSSDIIVRNIYIDEYGELDSNSKTNRNLYIEGEYLQNKGHISSRIALYAPPRIINFGSIDSTVYLKEEIYAIEGILKTIYLNGDIYINAPLFSHTINTNDYKILSHNDASTLTVGRIQGSLETNMIINFKCDADDIDTTKHAYLIQALEVHYFCKHYLDQNSDYTIRAQQVVVHEGVEIVPLGFFTSTLHMYADVVNKGLIKNAIIESHGNIDNRDGEITTHVNIYQEGPKSIKGYYNHLNIKNNIILTSSFTAKRLSSNENNLGVSDNSATITVGWLSDSITTDAHLVFNNIYSDDEYTTHYGDIYAKSITILGAHKLPNNQERKYTADSILIEDGAEIHPGTSRSTSSMIIDGTFHNKGLVYNRVRIGVHGSFINEGVIRGSFYLRLFPHYTDGSFNTFEISMKEEGGIFQSKVIDYPRYYNDIISGHHLNNILKHRDKRYWKVRMNDGQWSDIFVLSTYPEDLEYLIDSVNYFDIHVSKLHHGEDLYDVRIEAKDSHFSGTVFIDLEEQGYIKPNRLAMEDGVVETEVNIFNSASINSMVVYSGYQQYGKSNYFHGSSEEYGSLIGFINSQTESENEVTLRNKDNRYSTVTREDGSFSFHNVICGDYYITLEGNTSNRENNSLLERVSIPCNSVAIHTISTVFDSQCNVENKTPILLVPGILGSTSSYTLGIYPRLPVKRPLWNEGNMKIHNIVMGGGEYQVVDYIGWERIKKELQTLGYRENCTIFTVPYYWPDKASDNVNNYLIKVVQHAKFVSGSSKVNIIAHSMGGLVVREYLQSDSYSNDIDRVAMVGTPQQGSVLAYYIWEHGNTIQADGGYTTNFSFLSPAHFFYTHSLQKYFQEIRGFSPCINHNVLVTTNIWKLPVYCDSRVIKDFVREYVPALKELLPVYNNSLKNKNGNSVSSSNMWLRQLNQSFSEHNIEIDMISYIGDDTPTIETLILNNSGHITDTIKTQKGDGTVALKSSSIDNITISMKKGGHGRLPHIFLNEIIDFIDAPKTQILSDE